MLPKNTKISCLLDIGNSFCQQVNLYQRNKTLIYIENVVILKPSEGLAEQWIDTVFGKVLRSDYPCQGNIRISRKRAEVKSLLLLKLAFSSGLRPNLKLVPAGGFLTSLGLLTRFASQCCTLNLVPAGG